MYIRVISLSTALERRKHIQTEFGNQNINFEFFDALTPDLAYPLAQQLGLKFNPEILTKGELACFMSHVSIWKEMIDENIPYAAIFEDDVFLGEQAHKLLNDSTWIQPEWDIIKIEAFAERVFLEGNGTKIIDGQREIIKLVGSNLGTAGYILSLKGAQKYLDYVLKIHLIPLDQVMFDEFISDEVYPVYQMTPALCIQEMMLFPEKKTVLSSDLLAERKARMKKQKKKGWAKFQHEIFRIVTQIRVVMTANKVEFK